MSQRTTSPTRGPLRNVDTLVTIGSLFESQAIERPDATALAYEADSISYAMLNREADVVAEWLFDVGVAPEVAVGVCMQRTPSLIIVLLAIAKLGGTYVPLEPSYPLARLRYTVIDSKVQVVVCERRLAAQVEGLGSIVWWEDRSYQTPRSIARQPAATVHPDNALYVMYTSGSTGTPKGVVISQRAVLRLVHGADYVPLGPASVCLQCAPIAFDASTFEVWGPLLNGGRLVLPPLGAPSLAELARIIRTHGITTLFLTTALFEQMVERHVADLRGLDWLLTGGEVIPVSSSRRLMEKAPRVRLIAAYGPTENTTFSCCHSLRPTDLELGYVPIGAPIRGDTAFVVADAGNLADVGVAGELYVGGAGVARGYLDRAALSAERFVADAFSGVPGARLYRTGDRMRRAADGTFEFLGRFDDQVKIRGFRVEPGEVAAAIRKTGTVRDVIVVAKDSAAGGRELVAYLIPNGGISRFDSHGLRLSLEGHMPDYMVPARFVALAEFPLTSVGKVDRAALIRDTPTASDSTSARSAELVGTVGAVASAWHSAFNESHIALDDNFFDIGGDSLHALRLVAELRDRMSLELPIRSVFEHPTIRALSQEVERVRTRAKSQRHLIPRTSRSGPLPLSWSQERVWFVNELGPASLAYAFQATLHIKGDLDLKRLERCLRAIVSRHEVFRTTFQADRAGRPEAVIHASLEPFPFSLVDVREHPRKRRAPLVAEMIKREISAPFALHRLPLVRWVVYQTDEREHVLLHMEHHIIHDGWSLNSVVAELLERYRADATGERPQLPSLPVQFVDFAAWERSWTRTEEGADQLRYWVHQLAGAPSGLRLPFDYPRPMTADFSGAAFRVPVPVDTLAAIRRIARREGTGEFTVFLAAFALMLYHESGDSDLCVGVGVANRRASELQSLVGMLVNTVVIRLRMNPAMTLRDVVRQTLHVTLDAYERQECPFNEVVRAVAPRRSANRHPLYQVMFSMHDAPIRPVTVPGLTIGLHEGISNGSAKCDLNVIVIPPYPADSSVTRDGGQNMTTINWEYSTQLFDESTIVRLANQHLATLALIADTPSRLVDDLRF